MINRHGRHYYRHNNNPYFGYYNNPYYNNPYYSNPYMWYQNVWNIPYETTKVIVNESNEDDTIRESDDTNLQDKFPYKFMLIIIITLLVIVLFKN
jgi:hypothetical protein